MGNISSFFRRVFWPDINSYMSLLTLSNTNVLFQIDILITCLNLSLIAYNDEISIYDNIQNNSYIPGEIKESMKKEEIHFIDGNKNRQDTQLFFMKVGTDTAYIAFRGTNSLKDMIANIHIDQVKFPNKVKIHCGFYHQYIAIREDIDELIQKYKCKNLIFVGHSSGGACATIGAWDYGMNNDYNVSCYTYGCPRVGNTEFVKTYARYIKDSQSVRVFNRQDVVPMLYFTSNYEHVQRGLCFDDNGKFWQVVRDVPYASRPALNLKNIDYLEPFTEHKCATYLTYLKEVLHTP